MIFQILLQNKPLGEVSYPSLAQAAAVWREAGRGGRVVEVSTQNQIVNEFSTFEMEKAAEVFLKTR